MNQRAGSAASVKGTPSGSGAEGAAGRWLVERTTATRIRAAPPTIPGESGSPRKIRPSATATVGTYAYVNPVVAGSSFRQKANAVKPTSEPKTAR